VGVKFASLVLHIRKLFQQLLNPSGNPSGNELQEGAARALLEAGADAGALNADGDAAAGLAPAAWATLWGDRVYGCN